MDLVSNALLRLIEPADCGREDEKSRQPETLEVGVRDVIRTIWLASFGLALVGGLFATKVMPAPLAEGPTVAGGPAAPGSVLLRDASIKSDQAAVSRRGT